MNLNLYIDMEKLEEQGKLAPENQKYLETVRQGVDKYVAISWTPSRLEVRLKETTGFVEYAGSTSENDEFMEEELALQFARFVHYAIYRHKKVVDMMKRSMLQENNQTASADGEKSNDE